MQTTEEIECQACGEKAQPKEDELCFCPGCKALLTTDQGEDE